MRTPSIGKCRIPNNHLDVDRIAIDRGNGHLAGEQIGAEYAVIVRPNPEVYFLQPVDLQVVGQLETIIDIEQPAGNDLDFADEVEKRVCRPESTG